MRRSASVGTVAASQSWDSAGAGIAWFFIEDAHCRHDHMGDTFSEVTFIAGVGSLRVVDYEATTEGKRWFLFYLQFPFFGECCAVLWKGFSGAGGCRHQLKIIVLNLWIHPRPERL